MNNYEDIINLSRPISDRPKMSVQDRAAQFAPFAALTGYSDIIQGADRIIEKETYLGEDMKKIINDKLSQIETILKAGQVNLMIKYFIRDTEKLGGQYIKKYGVGSKIDKQQKKITVDDEKINFDQIIEIDICDTKQA